MKKEKTIVQHDGEFVLTREGSRDFGEISPEIAREIRRQAGKIRLRIGKQQDGEKGNYGEKHIECPDRMQQLRDNGYESARDLVQDVAQNFSAIYTRKGSGLIIHKKGYRDTMIYVELTPSKENDFYDVKTGLVTRNTYFKNKKPLWEKTQSG